MTDDGPCFFCGKTLTDMDGILECQEGCGAYEQYKFRNGKDYPPTGIEWVVPQEQVFKTFHVNEPQPRRSLKKYLLNTVLMTLAMHPVMLAILSPYMMFVVGLTWEQLVLWWWTGLFIGMFLNAVLAMFIGKTAAKMGRLVDRLVGATQR